MHNRRLSRCLSIIFLLYWHVVQNIAITSRVAANNVFNVNGAFEEEDKCDSHNSAGAAHSVLEVIRD